MPRRRAPKPKDAGGDYAEHCGAGESSEPDAYMQGIRERDEKPKGMTHSAAVAAARAMGGSHNGDADDSEVELPDMSDGVKRILVRILDVGEFEDVFVRLRDGLSLDDALNPQAVRAALNRTEACALLAHQLFVAVKTEFESFKLRADATVGSMREAAVDQLNATRGKGDKPLTDKDVDAKMHRMYPDEYREIRARRIQVEQTTAHVERLASLWEARGRSLKSLNDN